MIRRLALLLPPLAVLAAACVSTGPVPSSGGSGIVGLVTIGPMCPVVREDEPCPDQPYQATIVVQDESGSEVARVESGEDGRFSVSVPPGSYALVPQSPESRLPYAGEYQVEVPAGGYPYVHVEYDSGIR